MSDPTRSTAPADAAGTSADPAAQPAGKDDPAQTPAPQSPAADPRTHVAPPATDRLPLFKVLLHNDHHNDMVHVVETLMDLTPLNAHNATRVMLEAHQTGVALVLVTHRERAELYVEQFGAKKLTVTIEPEA